ncbi:hypothetical protein [Streptomyces sp. NPDC057509]|uniref:hypothetical protein n=1 Tax=Streptomyces sp. NPDC057509 TaxID=3346152 RepID=UPI0036C80632
MSFHSVAKHALTVYYDGDAELAGKLLDGVAHELAEKIRGDKCGETSSDAERCPCGAAAADLIDPGVPHA